MFACNVMADLVWMGWREREEREDEICSSIDRQVKISSASRVTWADIGHTETSLVRFIPPARSTVLLMHFSFFT